MTPGAGRLAALLLLAGCHTASEWVEVPRDAAVGAEVPSLDRGVTVDQGAADAGPAPVDRPTADLGFDTGPAPVDRPAVDLGVDAGPAPVDRGPWCSDPIR